MVVELPMFEFRYSYAEEREASLGDEPPVIRRFKIELADFVGRTLTYLSESQVNTVKNDIESWMDIVREMVDKHTFSGGVDMVPYRMRHEYDDVIVTCGIYVTP